MLQLDVTVDTKTEDNVFVKVVTSVQYHVLADKIYDAYYRLQDPELQITSFVFDVVRAHVPKMQLDDVFGKKEEIAESVKSELSEIISNMGFRIVKALVTDIDPDAKVTQFHCRHPAYLRERGLGRRVGPGPWPRCWYVL